MKRVLKLFLALVVLVGVTAGGGLTWASGKSADLRSRSIAVHKTDFPIPFALDETEVAALGFTPEQSDSAATARAIERGRHLAESRFACTVCHGSDFSGGVMVDVPIMGRILGPNLTTGQGSRTLNYTPGDWDRIVRHGVLPDNRPAAMPSEDFQRMSDQELSDLIVYIRSLPPVDNEVPPVTLGPLGTFLVATGKLPLSADIIGDHLTDHRAEPPPSEVSVGFGRHVAGVCVGCHRADLSGGPIVSGDPSWPPAANLTPHADGLGDWTYYDFVKALREGVRPDGTPMAVPMSDLTAYTRNMTDLEMEAVWAFLRSVPPLPSGA